MKAMYGIIGVCLLLGAMAFAWTTGYSISESYFPNGDFARNTEVRAWVGEQQINTLSADKNLWTCMGGGAAMKYNGQPDADKTIGGGVFTMPATPTTCKNAESMGQYSIGGGVFY